MRIDAPRGTRDIFGEEIFTWQFIEKNIYEICSLYNIKEIRTPMFEHTNLFLRGVGETTDIVEKEMYTFCDKKNRSITLRPEGTAGVVRAFIENNLHQNIPLKLFYIVDAFRYERPQFGRYRQFKQFGVEMFGCEEVIGDCEIISISNDFLTKIGIKNFKLKLNNIGCTSCKKIYNKILEDFLKSNLDTLCNTCQNRFGKNTLRILDCKTENCRKIIDEAPLPLDYLQDCCLQKFDDLINILKVSNINFEIDKKIVRGIDYYTNTVFEFVLEDFATQNVICGGGRYNNLVKSLGGPDTSAVGFGLGIDRLVLAIKNQNIIIPENRCTVFIGYLGEKALYIAKSIVDKLRSLGINSEIDLSQKSAKSQIKYANKINSKFFVLIGEDELQSKKVKIKNMDSKSEVEICIDDIIKFNF